MAHDVLQGFGVHTGIGHPRTEIMPEGVGCDFGKLLLVELVILLHKPFNHGIVVGRRLGQTVPVEEQEIRVAIHRDRLHLAASFEYAPEGFIGFLTHVELPDAAFGFRRFNIEAYFSVPQKLVVYQDGTVFEIQMGGETAKF